MNGIRRRYEDHFLAIEFSIACIIFSAFVAIVELSGFRYLLLDALDKNRQAIYSTMASVSGSLLGFVIASVSIILLFSQEPQMAKIKETGHLKTIYDINTQAIQWLAIATACAFLGLFLDTDKSPKIAITYAMMLIAVIVGLRVYRCVWILNRLAALMTPQS